MSRVGGRAWPIGVAVVVAAVCVLLGFWQLDRLRERRSFNGRVTAGLEAPATDLDRVEASPNLAYRRASAAGTYDLGHELVLFGRTLEGNPGNHLLTPLLLTDGSAVLVDRGWVPPDTRAPAPEGPVRVSGVLFPTDLGGGEPSATGHVRVVDVSAIGRGLPYELAPVYLLLQQQQPSPRGLPVPAPLPKLSEGPHLSYAIQWFAFAAVAMVGGVVVARRGRAVRPHDEASQVG